MIKNFESLSIEIERAIIQLIHHEQYAIEVVTHPQLDNYLNQSDKRYLEKMAAKENANLTFHTNDLLHLNEFEMYSATNGKKLEV